MEERNQKMQLDFLSKLPARWWAKKFLLTCLDIFSKIQSVQITTRTISKVIQEFLENYIASYAVSKAIRTDQEAALKAMLIGDFRTQK